MRSLLIVVSALLLAACVTSPRPTSSAPTGSFFESPPSSLAVLGTVKAPTSAHMLVSDMRGLWSRIRGGFQMPDLNNNLVQMQLTWYAARPEYLERMIERSKRYLYHVVREIEKRGMPSELALLPFIESAYNPQALSVAKAAGMWQFMPATGRAYGLDQNIFHDKRRDVLASTSAALNYLSELYSMFGDWYLALAAYDWGPGNVQRAIARNRRAGISTDYKSLNMPNETRNYVPKLQALKEIISNPRKYGVALAKIPDHPYFVSITVKRDIDVAVAAQLAGLPLKEFQALNPSFSKSLIVGASQPHILLPFENAQAFETALRAYEGPLSSWTAYTITRREQPAALAARLGVAPARLISVNKIPAGARLRPGSTILVPRSEQDQDISAYIAKHAVLALEPNVPNRRRLSIRIRPRDTLIALARRYHVSVAQIKAWNKIRGTRLIAGRTLQLYAPGRATQVRRVVRRPNAARGGVVRAAVSARHRPVRRPIIRRAGYRSRAVRTTIRSRR